MTSGSNAVARQLLEVFPGLKPGHRCYASNVATMSGGLSHVVLGDGRVPDTGNFLSLMNNTSCLLCRLARHGAGADRRRRNCADIVVLNTVLYPGERTTSRTAISGTPSVTIDADRTCRSPLADVSLGTAGGAPRPYAARRRRFFGTQYRLPCRAAPRLVVGESVIEILEEPEEPEDRCSTAMPVMNSHPHAAWGFQVGCDNSCAFCIVPAVRRRTEPGVRTSSMRSPSAGAALNSTLLGQNVNSYGRDPRQQQAAGDAASPTIEQFMVRCCSPTCCARSARSTASNGAVRIQKTCDPRLSPRWPRRRRSASSSTCRSSPVATGCRGYTAERYLERVYGGSCRDPDLKVTTDIIVGFR